jgi:endoglucanase
MARVKEVVDYAVANDMYILLNSHHDEFHGHGTTDRLRFTGTEAQIQESLNAYRKLWEQIADAFKDYNEKLIFEALNEPRNVGSPQAFSGGTRAERNILNRYYPVFVDVVRNSGGNNDKRILLINTYAAVGVSDAVNGLVLPADTVQNKLAVTIHVYAPGDFSYPSGSNRPQRNWNPRTAADTRAIRDVIQPAYNKFVRNGIPVIIGEFGAQDQNGNTSARAAWAEYVVSYAKSQGMPCFVWDNMAPPRTGEQFGLLNRNTNQWIFPEILEAIMRGADSNP